MKTNQEHEHAINGVVGRMFARHTWPNGLFSSQTWKASRAINAHETITVELRFDDNCRNGHQSFAITGTVRDSRVRRDGGFVMGGCIHDEIRKHFPELAELIQFHLCDTPGPMHYLANAVYLAGDRDCWGLRAGEARQIRNGKTGELAWIRKGPGTQYHDGPTPPDESVTVKWEPWLRIGEGKARELDAARLAAIWPEATDAELMQEPEALKQALTARLPALVARFRTAMVETCGFEWVELETVES